VLIEGDFSEHSMNLYLNGELVSDFVPFADGEVGRIDRLHLTARGHAEIEDIFLFNHDPAFDTPGTTLPFIDHPR
jgi:hypothetical protein